jgi:hypothetical protein
MTDESNPTPVRELKAAAYAAFERGALAEACSLFSQLVSQRPGVAAYHYMLGLAHKYRREWAQCIEHNRRAIAVADAGEDLDAQRWNIAIAASALGDWALAREQWIAAGIELEPGDAPLDEDRGVVSVRLNPWSDGETLFADRIGLARARLRNVPLPESGYRFGDLVVIDGAKTGERRYGNSTVPVFNVLQRLQPSEFATYAVRVECAAEADADALEASNSEGIGCIEDWSRSMSYLCVACSYGQAHTHQEQPPAADGWVRERHLGIAARSEEAVEDLLEAWMQQGREGQFLARLARRRPRRAVLDIIRTDCPEPGLPESGTWWNEPAQADP